MATLEISHIYANPPGPDRLLDRRGRRLGRFTNLRNELVMIVNRSSTPVDMSGYALQDSNRHRFIFPPGAIIGANSFIFVCSGPGLNSSTIYYWNRRMPVWNNEGDTALLKDRNGAIVSELRVVKIYGYVYDRETGRGVEGAYVYDENGQTVRTNAFGYYELLTKTGAQEISAFSDGYATATDNVEIAAQTSHNFYLSVEPENISEEREINISLSIREVITPNPAYLKQPFDIVVIFQNNADPIDYFESHLFEGNREVNDYHTANTTSGIITATYQLPPKDWDWYRIDLDTVGYAQLLATENWYSYRLTYFGKQGSTMGPLIPEDISVRVVVSQTKRDALDDYNLAWTAFLGTTAVTIAADILSFGVLTILGAAVIVAADASKDDAKDRMDDPITFDKKFKQIYKIPKVKFIDFGPASKFANACINFRELYRAKRVTVNRAFSAQYKMDKKALRRQIDYLTKLATKFKQIKKDLGKQWPELEPLRKFKLSKKQFLETQKIITKKGLPKNIADKVIAAGMSKAQLRQILKIFVRLKFSRKYTDIDKSLSIFQKSMNRLLDDAISEIVNFKRTFSAK